MNGLDPTSSKISSINAAQEECSVEDLIEIETSAAISTELAKEEPTGAAAPLPLPKPIPPIQLRKRPVSGRYRNPGTGWQLELRVDVDRVRPMKRVSGDFYQVSGNTVLYFGSFVINGPIVTVTSSLVTIEGLGTFTWSAGAPKLKVTIPRTSIFGPPASATAQFLTTSGSPGAIYVCPFQSIYFRTAQYEQDVVSDVVTPAFTSYNTGSLPSGGPARTLSVAGAYAEAGIEMQTAGVWNVVPVSGAGPDSKWSNAELHAAMQTQFSLWKEEPQWKVWLLATQLHEMGPGLYGIMFDQQGKQRQGCAVFHYGIGGTTSDKLRLQLYTYVHELGHCFNLLHSWQKSYAVPPVPNRPSALSWMNYPWNYPGGANAFWTAFPFQFDDPEVIHLRHAFRNNIIMGGNNFAVGAALEDPQAFADPVEDNSGLKLELETRKSFASGEPIVVEIKLRTTDTRGKRVNSQLHPNAGFVQVGIRKPSGEVMVYEPLMEHCIVPEMTVLDAENPSIYDSAFIGYGKGGFYFDQAGQYQLRAVYYALDGSLVLSDIITLRVRSPLSSTDEEVADLFIGDEQGTLLYLLGSDSNFLKKGNEAFDQVLESYGDHVMAVYTRLVKGINSGREFKSMTPQKTMTVRKPQHKESIGMLSDVVDASEAGKGVDNITLNMAMRRMASAQKSLGDKKGAKETIERMVSFFEKKSVKPHVMRLIEAQAKTI